MNPTNVENRMKCYNLYIIFLILETIIRHIMHIALYFEQFSEGRYSDIPVGLEHIPAINWKLTNGNVIFEIFNIHREMPMLFCAQNLQVQIFWNSKYMPYFLVIWSQQCIALCVVFMATLWIMLLSTGQFVTRQSMKNRCKFCIRLFIRRISFPLSHRFLICYPVNMELYSLSIYINRLVWSKVDWVVCVM